MHKLHGISLTHQFNLYTHISPKSPTMLVMKMEKRLAQRNWILQQLSMPYDPYAMAEHSTILDGVGCDVHQTKRSTRSVNINQANNRAGPSF